MAALTVVAGFLSTAHAETTNTVPEPSGGAEGTAPAENGITGPTRTPSPAAPAAFDIWEYRIQGNTILPAIDLERAVYPFLGPSRTVDDVDRARAALEELYGNLGYFTVSVSIPEQDASGGVITLDVTERRVGRLRVRGARYYSLTDVKDGAPSLAEGTIPNFNDVQRDLLQLNLQVGRQVTPNLKPGVRPDTVDVDLQVEDQLPFHASLELNNQHSANTEDLRLLGSVRYDNLWQRGHSLNLSYLVAPENTDNARVFSGSYVAPIPGTRLSALIFGVASESDVPSVIGGSVIGDGEIIGGRLIGILSIEDGFVQSLSGGFDYKSFEEVADDIPTRVTYFPITLDYFGSVTTEDAETNFGTGLVFSLRQPASSDRRFDEKRFGARRNFAYVTGELSRLQKLPEDIQVYGRFRTQLAQQPLISNEQFSLGGVDSVRGYLEGEELGDYGVAFQSEVRSPSLGPLVAQDLNELRFYGFFDIGQAGIVDPLPEQEQTFFLNSFGMGARIKAFESIQGSVDIAVARTGASNTDAGDVRTHFRVSGEF